MKQSDPKDYSCKICYLKKSIVYLLAECVIEVTNILSNMKKVLFLIAAACILAPATVLAQDVKVTRNEDENTITIVEETTSPDGKIITTTVLEKNSVFTNGFWHNWELSAGLGTHLYYGDNDWKVANKFEMFTFPAVDLYLTKWASPSFGVGLGFTAGKFKGLYQTTPIAATYTNRSDSSVRMTRRMSSIIRRLIPSTTIRISPFKRVASTISMPLPMPTSAT